MDRKNIDGNIGKYYLVMALTYFSFYTPISQLFYLAKGLTVLEIATLGVVWTVVKIILEVPSSMAADKWGRKKVMLISLVLGMLQLSTLIAGRGYMAYILASIWSAASFAFMSGTNVAFFYDSLKEAGREDEFDRLWARQQVYTQVPLLISFLSSGILFGFSPLLPFQLSLLFLVVAGFVSLSLTEPKFFKPVEEVDIWSNLKQSLRYIWQSKQLRFILGYILIFSLGSDISYGYGQVYLKQLNFPVVLFGVVYTLKSIFCTVAANLIPTLQRAWSTKIILGLQMFMLTGLFWLMVVTNNKWVGAICFALIALPYGLFEISKSGYVHKIIPSHQRATIDSMFSFLVSAMFLVVEPVFGWLVDSVGIKFPFGIIAVVLSIYSVYYLTVESKRI